MEQMRHATANRAKGEMFYGRRGTPTHFAFQAAIAELEGGVGTALYPSGSAAISGALLSFLKAGDHLLMVDSVYEPPGICATSCSRGWGLKPVTMIP